MEETAVATWWQGVLSYLHPIFLWHWLTGSHGWLYKFYRNIKSGFDPRFRRRRRLLSWVEQSAGREVVDLASLWRDGTILCDVIHRTCPSSCQGWEDSHNKNTFRHAQALAYRCLLLQPAFSEVDLSKTEMTPNIEKRLFRYLQSLKLAVSKKHLNRSVEDESDAEVLIADEYIARGMGLIMGSRNHKAIFYIYSRDGSSLLDIHIEIRGPGEDFGSALVTQNGSMDSTEEFSIPIEYRITNEYLRVSYQPKNVGHHELSISRHGYIIPGSPFIISVDEISEQMPKKRFNSIEWYTEDEDRRQKGLQNKKKNAKVKCRIVDFVTEKMYLTEDGKLLKIPDDVTSCTTPPPPNFPAPGPPFISEPPLDTPPSPALSCDSRNSHSRRSISPRLKKKKREKPKWANVKPDSLKYIILKPPKLQVKRVSDAASQAMLEFQPSIFQEKCKRIVSVCDYLLRHCPRQTSLDIISGAGHILQSNKVENSPVLNTAVKQAIIQYPSVEDDDDVFVSSTCTSPTVTTITYPQRCRSVSLSFVNDDMKTDNENDETTEEAEITTRSRKESQDSLTCHSASLARKSFKTEGNTKSPRRRSSFSSISQNDCNDLIEGNNNYDDFLTVDGSDITMSGPIVTRDQMESGIKLISYTKFEERNDSFDLLGEKKFNNTNVHIIDEELTKENEICDIPKEIESIPDDKLLSVNSETCITMQTATKSMDVNNYPLLCDSNVKSVCKLQIQDRIDKTTTSSKLVGKIIAQFETNVHREINLGNVSLNEQNCVEKQSKEKRSAGLFCGDISLPNDPHTNKVKHDSEYVEKLHIEYLKSIGASDESLSTIKSKIELFEKGVKSHTKNKIVYSPVRFSISKPHHNPVCADDSNSKILPSTDHVFRAEPAIVVSKHYAELHELTVQPTGLTEGVYFDFQPPTRRLRNSISDINDVEDAADKNNINIVLDESSQEKTPQMVEESKSQYQITTTDTNYNKYNEFISKDSLGNLLLEKTEVPNSTMESHDTFVQTCSKHESTNTSVDCKKSDIEPMGTVQESSYDSSDYGKQDITLKEINLSNSVHLLVTNKNLEENVEIVDCVSKSNTWSVEQLKNQHKEENTISQSLGGRNKASVKCKRLVDTNKKFFESLNTHNAEVKTNRLDGYVGSSRFCPEGNGNSPVLVKTNNTKKIQDNYFMRNITQPVKAKNVLDSYENARETYSPQPENIDDSVSEYHKETTYEPSPEKLIKSEEINCEIYQFNANDKKTLSYNKIEPSVNTEDIAPSSDTLRIAFTLNSSSKDNSSDDYPLLQNAEIPPSEVEIFNNDSENQTHNASEDTTMNGENQRCVQQEKNILSDYQNIYTHITDSEKIETLKENDQLILIQSKTEENEELIAIGAHKNEGLTDNTVTTCFPELIISEVVDNKNIENSYIKAVEEESGKESVNCQDRSSGDVPPLQKNKTLNTIVEKINSDSQITPHEDSKEATDIQAHSNLQQAEKVSVIDEFELNTILHIDKLTDTQSNYINITIKETNKTFRKTDLKAQNQSIAENRERKDCESPQNESIIQDQSTDYTPLQKNEIENTSFGKLIQKLETEQTNTQDQSTDTHMPLENDELAVGYIDIVHKIILNEDSEVDNSCIQTHSNTQQAVESLDCCHFKSVEKELEIELSTQSQLTDGNTASQTGEILLDKTDNIPGIIQHEDSEEINISIQMQSKAQESEAILNDCYLKPFEKNLRTDQSTTQSQSTNDSNPSQIDEIVAKKFDSVPQITFADFEVDTCVHEPSNTEQDAELFDKCYVKRVDEELGIEKQSTQIQSTDDNALLQDGEISLEKIDMVPVIIQHEDSEEINISVQTQCKTHESAEILDGFYIKPDEKELGIEQPSIEVKPTNNSMLPFIVENAVEKIDQSNNDLKLLQNHVIAVERIKNVPETIQNVDSEVANISLQSQSNTQQPVKVTDQHYVKSIEHGLRIEQSGTKDLSIDDPKTLQDEKIAVFMDSAEMMLQKDDLLVDTCVQQAVKVLHKCYDNLIEKEIGNEQSITQDKSTDLTLLRENETEVTAAGNIDSVIPYILHEDSNVDSENFQNDTNIKQVGEGSEKCYITPVEEKLGTEQTNTQDQSNNDHMSLHHNEIAHIGIVCTDTDSASQVETHENSQVTNMSIDIQSKSQEAVELSDKCVKTVHKEIRRNQTIDLSSNDLRLLQNDKITVEEIGSDPEIIQRQDSEVANICIRTISNTPLPVEHNTDCASQIITKDSEVGNTCVQTPLNTPTPTEESDKCCFKFAEEELRIVQSSTQYQSNNDLTLLQKDGITVERIDVVPKTIQNKEAEEANMNVQSQRNTQQPVEVTQIIPETIQFETSEVSKINIQTTSSSPKPGELLEKCYATSDDEELLIVQPSILYQSNIELTLLQNDELKEEKIDIVSKIMQNEYNEVNNTRVHTQFHTEQPVHISDTHTKPSEEELAFEQLVIQDQSSNYLTPKNDGISAENIDCVPETIQNEDSEISNVSTQITCTNPQLLEVTQNCDVKTVKEELRLEQPNTQYRSTNDLKLLQNYEIAAENIKTIPENIHHEDSAVVNVNIHAQYTQQPVQILDECCLKAIEKELGTEQSISQDQSCDKTKPSLNQKISAEMIDSVTQIIQREDTEVNNTCPEPVDISNHCYVKPVEKELGIEQPSTQVQSKVESIPLQNDEISIDKIDKVPEIIQHEDSEETNITVKTQSKTQEPVEILDDCCRKPKQSTNQDQSTDDFTPSLGEKLAVKNIDSVQQIIIVSASEIDNTRVQASSNTQQHLEVSNKSYVKLVEDNLVINQLNTQYQSTSNLTPVKHDEIVVDNTGGVNQIVVDKDSAEDKIYEKTQCNIQQVVKVPHEIKPVVEELGIEQSNTQVQLTDDPTLSKDDKILVHKIHSVPETTQNKDSELADMSVQATNYTGQTIQVTDKWYDESVEEDCRIDQLISQDRSTNEIDNESAQSVETDVGKTDTVYKIILSEDSEVNNRFVQTQSNTKQGIEFFDNSLIKSGLGFEQPNTQVQSTDDPTPLQNDEISLEKIDNVSVIIQHEDSEDITISVQTHYKTQECAEILDDFCFKPDEKELGIAQLSTKVKSTDNFTPSLDVENALKHIDTFPELTENEVANTSVQSQYNTQQPIELLKECCFKPTEKDLGLEHMVTLDQLINGATLTQNDEIVVEKTDNVNYAMLHEDHEIDNTCVQTKSNTQHVIDKSDKCHVKHAGEELKIAQQSTQDQVTNELTLSHNDEIVAEKNVIIAESIQNEDSDVANIRTQTQYKSQKSVEVIDDCCFKPDEKQLAIAQPITKDQSTVKPTLPHDVEISVENINTVHKSIAHEDPEIDDLNVQLQSNIQQPQSTDLNTTLSRNDEIVVEMNDRVCQIIHEECELDNSCVQSQCNTQQTVELLVTCHDKPVETDLGIEQPSSPILDQSTDDPMLSQDNKIALEYSGSAPQIFIHEVFEVDSTCVETQNNSQKYVHVSEKNYFKLVKEEFRIEQPSSQDQAAGDITPLQNDVVAEENIDHVSQIIGHKEFEVDNACVHTKLNVLPAIQVPGKGHVKLVEEELGIDQPRIQDPWSKDLITLQNDIFHCEVVHPTLLNEGFEVHNASVQNQCNIQQAAELLDKCCVKPVVDKFGIEQPSAQDQATDEHTLLKNNEILIEQFHGDPQNVINEDFKEENTCLLDQSNTQPDVEESSECKGKLVGYELEIEQSITQDQWTDNHMLLENNEIAVEKSNGDPQNVIHNDFKEKNTCAENQSNSQSYVVESDECKEKLIGYELDIEQSITQDQSTNDSVLLKNNEIVIEQFHGDPQNVINEDFKDENTCLLDQSNTQPYVEESSECKGKLVDYELEIEQSITQDQSTDDIMLLENNEIAIEKSYGDPQNVINEDFKEENTCAGNQSNSQSYVEESDECKEKLVGYELDIEQSITQDQSTDDPMLLDNNEIVIEKSYGDPQNVIYEDFKEENTCLLDQSNTQPDLEESSECKVKLVDYELEIEQSITQDKSTDDPMLLENNEIAIEKSYGDPQNVINEDFKEENTCAGNQSNSQSYVEESDECKEKLVGYELDIEQSITQDQSTDDPMLLDNNEIVIEKSYGDPQNVIYEDFKEENTCLLDQSNTQPDLEESSECKVKLVDYELEIEQSITQDQSTDDPMLLENNKIAIEKSNGGPQNVINEDFKEENTCAGNQSNSQSYVVESDECKEMLVGYELDIEQSITQDPSTDDSILLKNNEIVIEKIHDATQNVINETFKEKNTCVLNQSNTQPDVEESSEYKGKLVDYELEIEQSITQDQAAGDITPLQNDVVAEENIDHVSQIIGHKEFEVDNACVHTKLNVLPAIQVPGKGHVKLVEEELGIDQPRIQDPWSKDLITLQNDIFHCEVVHPTLLNEGFEVHNASVQNQCNIQQAAELLDKCCVKPVEDKFGIEQTSTQDQATDEHTLLKNSEIVIEQFHGDELEIEQSITQDQWTDDHMLLENNEIAAEKSNGDPQNVIHNDFKENNTCAENQSNSHSYVVESDECKEKLIGYELDIEQSITQDQSTDDSILLKNNEIVIEQFHGDPQNVINEDFKEENTCLLDQSNTQPDVEESSECKGKLVGYELEIIEQSITQDQWTDDHMLLENNEIAAQKSNGDLQNVIHNDFKEKNTCAENQSNSQSYVVESDECKEKLIGYELDIEQSITQDQSTDDSILLKNNKIVIEQFHGDPQNVINEDFKEENTCLLDQSNTQPDVEESSECKGKLVGYELEIIEQSITQDQWTDDHMLLENNEIAAQKSNGDPQNVIHNDFKEKNTCAENQSNSHSYVVESDECREKLIGYELDIEQSITQDQSTDDSILLKNNEIVIEQFHGDPQNVINEDFKEENTCLLDQSNTQPDVEESSECKGKLVGYELEIIEQSITQDQWTDDHMLLENNEIAAEKSNGDPQNVIHNDFKEKNTCAENQSNSQSYVVESDECKEKLIGYELDIEQSITQDQSTDDSILLKNNEIVIEQFHGDPQNVLNEDFKEENTCLLDQSNTQPYVEESSECKGKLVDYELEIEQSITQDQSTDDPMLLENNEIVIEKSNGDPQNVINEDFKEENACAGNQSNFQSYVEESDECKENLVGYELEIEQSITQDQSTDDPMLLENNEIVIEKSYGAPQNVINEDFKEENTCLLNQSNTQPDVEESSECKGKLVGYELEIEQSIIQDQSTDDPMLLENNEIVIEKSYGDPQNVINEDFKEENTCLLDQSNTQPDVEESSECKGKLVGYELEIEQSITQDQSTDDLMLLENNEIAIEKSHVNSQNMINEDFKEYSTCEQTQSNTQSDVEESNECKGNPVGYEVKIEQSITKDHTEYPIFLVNNEISIDKFHTIPQIMVYEDLKEEDMGCIKTQSNFLPDVEESDISKIKPVGHELEIERSISQDHTVDPILLVNNEIPIEKIRIIPQIMVHEDFKEGNTYVQPQSNGQSGVFIRDYSHDEIDVQESILIVEDLRSDKTSKANIIETCDLVYTNKQSNNLLNDAITEIHESISALGQNKNQNHTSSNIEKPGEVINIVENPDLPYVTEEFNRNESSSELPEYQSEILSSDYRPGDDIIIPEGQYPKKYETTDKNKSTFAARDLYLKLVSNIETPEKRNYGVNEHKQTVSERQNVDNTICDYINKFDKTPIITSDDLLCSIDESQSNVTTDNVDHKIVVLENNEMCTKIQNTNLDTNTKSIAHKIRQFIFSESDSYDIRSEEHVKSLKSQQNLCLQTSIKSLNDESNKNKPGLDNNDEDDAMSSCHDKMIISSSKLNSKRFFNQECSNIKQIKELFENLPIKKETGSFKIDHDLPIVNNVSTYKSIFDGTNDSDYNSRNVELCYKEKVISLADTDIKSKVVFVGNDKESSFNDMQTLEEIDTKITWSGENVYIGNDHYMACENKEDQPSQKVSKEINNLYLLTNNSSYSSKDVDFFINKGTEYLNKTENENINRLYMESNSLDNNLLTVEQELCEVLSIEDEEMDRNIEIEMSQIDAMETPEIKDTDFIAFRDKYVLENQSYLTAGDEHCDASSIEDETMDLDIQKEISEVDELPSPETNVMQKIHEFQNDNVSTKKIIHIDPTLLRFDSNEDDMSSIEDETLDKKLLDEVNIVDSIPYIDGSDFKINQNISQEVNIVKPRLVIVHCDFSDTSNIEDEEIDIETQKELLAIENFNENVNEGNEYELSSSAIGYFTENPIGIDSPISDNSNQNMSSYVVDIQKLPTLESECDDAVPVKPGIIPEPFTNLDQSTNSENNIHSKIFSLEANNYDLFTDLSSDYKDSCVVDSCLVNPFEGTDFSSLQPSFDSLQSDANGGEESLSEKFTHFSENDLSISSESESVDFQMWSSNVEFGDPSDSASKVMDFDSIISAPNLNEALKKLEMHIQDKGDDFQWLSARTPSPSLQSLEKYFKDGISCFDTDEFHAEVSGGILQGEESNEESNHNVEECTLASVWATPSKALPECSFCPDPVQTEEFEVKEQEDDTQVDWIISPYQYPRVLLGNTAQMSIIDEEDDSRKSEPLSPTLKKQEHLSYNSNQSGEEFSSVEQEICERTIGDSARSITQLSIGENTLEGDRVVDILNYNSQTNLKSSNETDSWQSSYENEKIFNEHNVAYETNSETNTETGEIASLANISDNGSTNQVTYIEVNRNIYDNTTIKSEVEDSCACIEGILEGEVNEIEGLSVKKLNLQQLSDNLTETDHEDIKCYTLSEVKCHQYNKKDDIKDDLGEKQIYQQTLISHQERKVKNSIRVLLEGDIESISDDMIDEFSVSERKLYWDKKLQKLQDTENQITPMSESRKLSKFNSRSVLKLASRFDEKNHSSHSSVLNTSNTSSTIASEETHIHENVKNQETKLFIKTDNDHSEVNTSQPLRRETTIDETASMKLVSYWKSYWDDLVTEQRDPRENFRREEYKMPSIRVQGDDDNDDTGNDETLHNTIQVSNLHNDTDNVVAVIGNKFNSNEIEVTGSTISMQNNTTSLKTDTNKSIIFLSNSSNDLIINENIVSKCKNSDPTVNLKNSKSDLENFNDIDEHIQLDDNSVIGTTTSNNSEQTEKERKGFTEITCEKTSKTDSRERCSKSSDIGQTNEIKIRFEKAKQFFKHLEQSELGGIKGREYRSMPRLDLVSSNARRPSVDSDSGADIRPRKQRGRYKSRRKKRKDSTKVQSAPTSDTETSKRVKHNDSFDSFGGSVKSIKVSDRFHVKDLFRDVSGNGGIFKGIPNRAAVLASLKSVDDVRALSPYQIDFVDLKSSSSLGNIPSGFQEEYPYLPTTPVNRFRPRSALEFNLIPRSELLEQQF